jgi:NADP-dependent 3-hydroxy acid dehydrogenase YdfG
MRLEKVTALVTGASSGIGEELLRRISSGNSTVDITVVFASPIST